MKTTKHTNTFKLTIYVLLAVVCILPFANAPIALFLGLLYGLSIGTPFKKFNKSASKYLLQISVIGLGFGMNISESLHSGYDGMVFTIISVITVLFISIYLGKLLGINKISSYLIGSGTAICGGSAIAAVGPIAKANESEMTVSLATVFILNAIGLFIFPPLGHLLQLSEHQFGIWVAIAIHDTSSVVGAAATYGNEALKIATTVKLTRALWIIPLSVFTVFYFKAKGEKITIPWFIFLFILAMILNSYINIPDIYTQNIVAVSRKMLTLTLYFIGVGLTRETLKSVGFKPMLLGVILWIFIGSISLIFIYFAY